MHLSHSKNIPFDTSILTSTNRAHNKLQELWYNTQIISNSTSNIKGDISPLVRRGTGHNLEPTKKVGKKGGKGGKKRCDWPSALAFALLRLKHSQLEEVSVFLMLEDVNWLGSNLNTKLTTGNNMTYSSPISEEEKYFHSSILASCPVESSELLLNLFLVIFPALASVCSYCILWHKFMQDFFCYVPSLILVEGLIKD